MMEYLERKLGYKPHTAAERLRVARVITELPLIAEALAQGELAHSAVRELSRVAVPETEDAWLEAVRGKCVREIEAMVSGHKAGDLVSASTCPSTPRGWARQAPPCPRSPPPQQVRPPPRREDPRGHGSPRPLDPPD